mgnify:CR=1 FL=1
MLLESFIVTVKHDNGTTRIRVDSLNGEQEVRQRIMTTELCPERAITKIRKVVNKKIS